MLKEGGNMLRLFSFRGWKSITVGIILCNIVAGVTVEAADAETLLAEGAAGIVAADYNKAYEAYSQAIAQNDKLAVAFVGRAKAAKRLGNFDECIKDLDMALSLEPGNAVYWFNRGCVYQEYNFYDEAIADFLKAYEIEPRGLYSLMNLVMTYQSTKDYANAVIYADKMVELYESNDYVFAEGLNFDKETQALMYASAASAHHQLHSKEHNEKALALCDKAVLSDDMTTHWGLYMRSSVYLALDDPEKALIDCNKAFELCKEKTFEPFLYILRSSIFHKQKKDQEALQEINKCLDVWQDYRDAYLTRADIYYALNDLESAKADGRKYLELGGSKEKMADWLKKMLGIG